MITLTRRYEIACAHRLAVGPQKCKRLHGHNYTVDVTIERRKEPLKDGFVHDADHMDASVLPVLREIDHHPLHDLFTEWGYDAATAAAMPETTRNLVDQPTVENLAEYLWARLQFMARSEHRLVSVRVYEEPWLWAERTP